MAGLIAVGVDGSHHASVAAELAADAAARRSAVLAVLHAFIWPLAESPLIPNTVTEHVNPRRQARELVDTVSAAAVERYPGLTARGLVVDGIPSAVLVDASRRADLLYVGHRGIGGFAEFVVGSVGISAITHAHCPVVVVRGEKPAPGAPVVVGVDGSPDARLAARTAFEEARWRGVELIAALVWPPNRVWRHAVTQSGVAARDGAYDPMEVGLAGIAEDFPDVTWTPHVGRDTMAAEYLERLAADRGAALVVVGTRGGGGLRGLLLGGTCRHLVDHAPCPVLVTRPAERVVTARATEPAPRRRSPGRRQDRSAPGRARPAGNGSP